MNQIGRKIYYLLSNGNVILDTGEMVGDVSATTEAEDFQNYTALQPYQQSAVGMIQLEYGQYDTNFAQYSYSVDITQNPPVIAWDAPTLSDVQAAQINVITAGYNQTMAGGFQSNATGTLDYYQIAGIAMGQWTGVLAVIDAGNAPSTQTVKDINGNQVTLTQSQFKQFALDGLNFFNTQEQQLWALENQIKTLATQSGTTAAQINAIQWSPGAYTPQPAPTS